MSAREVQVVRQGSAIKRARILAAARDLFYVNGYDRTSVDAVCAHAGVSKRTVYDYYGDKRGLLLAVLGDAGASLVAAIQLAMDTHLTQVGDLHAALTAFARHVVTEAFASSDYVVLRRLLANETEIAERSVRDLLEAPEHALTRCFGALAEQGYIDAPNPRLAADHFVALTFSLAIDRYRYTTDARDQRVDQAVTEGVSAFLRAYAAPS